MKAAVIVFADSVRIGQSVAELSSQLSGLAFHLESLEMWVVCQHHVPLAIPLVHSPLSSLLLLPINQPGVPEAILPSLVSLQAQRKMDLLIFPSESSGQELCTRLAFRTGGSASVHVEQCFLVENTIEVERQVYGNNLVARMRLGQKPYCISVAKQAVQPFAAELVQGAVMVEIPHQVFDLHWLRERDVREEAIASDLAGASVVLALGNGVKNRTDFTRLQMVAETINAEIGVSRPVAMNGWITMDRLIGASGQILSPRLCIAAGVSGSAVFNSGIENSEFLVAINSDRQAGIFAIADIGIVDDLFAVLFELEHIIRHEKERRLGSSAQPHNGGK